MFRQLFRVLLLSDRADAGAQFEAQGGAAVVYSLGPNLSLHNCNVVLKVSARNLIIVGARFIDCTFEVKQELKNHPQWVKASLKGCCFKGRPTGCDFGHGPDYGTGWEHGAIEDCDFTVPVRRTTC